MHNLLSQLRNHSPAAVTGVADQGEHLRIELRYGQVVGTVLCRKTTPLGRGDVVFLHNGGTSEIDGSSPAERARVIVEHMAAQGARWTSRTGHWTDQSL
jgi:hypothetical protein